MRTAIVSDLHLGNAFGEDLLRDADLRRTLLDEIASAVLDLARPFFEELGEAMAGREIVLVPGNHDHRLAEPLLERVARENGGGLLGLEQRAEPREEPAASLDGWLGDAELTLAYTGVWLRDDVYATHGHYMDCHMSLPRIECIAAAAAMRAFGQVPDQASAGQTAQHPQTAQTGQAAGAAGAGQAVADTGTPEGGPGGPGGQAAPALAAARGNIDDDEHLDAYNAYLARLNQAERRPGQ